MADIIAITLTGVDQVSPAANSVAASLGTLEQKAGGTGSIIGTALGGVAVAGVAALGGAFVGAVTSAMSFEKGMSAISAVSGASASEMQALTSTVLQLGKDTSFSATEAATGVEELIKAGISIGDVMGGAARASLDLAAAGAVSVGEAATIASNAMNAFGLSGADMTHVADEIAGAANASAIDVHEFGFSLSAAGAVAHTIGIGFDDLTVAIAAMGNAGIKGSDAGTSLKTMMLNLSPSTKKATEEFQALGLMALDSSREMEILRNYGFDPTGMSAEAMSDKLFDLVTGHKAGTAATKEQVKAWDEAQAELHIYGNKFFDASGKVKSFRDISETLKDALKDLTQEQQISALKTLFGTDAVRAAAIMAQLGAEKYDELAASIGKVTAMQVANERLNNLSGSLEKLKGSLETAAIMVGSLVTPVLKGWADAATEAVNQAIGVIEQLPDIWRTIGQVFENDWSPDDSINPITNAVGMLAVAFRDQVMPTVTAVTAVFTGTLIPAFQAATGFLIEHNEAIAGVLAGYLAFRASLAIVSTVTAITGAFSAMGTAISVAGGVIPAIIAVLGGPLTIAIVAVAAIVGVLTAAWIGNWGDIQGKTATAVEFVTGLFNETLIPAFNTIVTALGDAGTAIADWSTNAVTAISTWVTTTGQAITDWATTAQQTFSDWATAVQDALTTWGTTAAGLVTAAMGLVQAAIDTGIDLLTTAWTTGWGALQAIQTAAWALLTPENQTKLAELATLTTTFFGTTLPALWTAGLAAIGTILTDWWTTATTTWTTSTNTVTTTVTTWWTTLSGLWTTGLAAITAIVTPWWTAATELWTTSTAAIATVVTDWWTTLSTAWTTGTAAIAKTVTDWWTAESTEAATMMAAIKKVIDDQLQTWGTAFSTALAAIGKLITDAGTTLGENAKTLGAAIVAGIVTGVNSVISTIADALTAGIRGAIDAAKRLIPSASVAPGGGGGSGAGLMSNTAGGSNGSTFTPMRSIVPFSSGGGGAVAQVNQMKQGLSNADALAACGPAALDWFRQINGRNPDINEALAAAKQTGWTPGRGMAGAGSFSQAATNLGIPNTFLPNPSPADIEGLAQSGQPFALSTTGHYFQVQGGNLQGLNVGGSGTALTHGAPVMSLEQIQQLMGPVNGVIVPNMPAAPSGGFPQLPGMNRVPISPSPLNDQGLGLSAWSPKDMQAIIDLGPPWEQTMQAVATGATTAVTSVTDLGNGFTMTVKNMGADSVATITDSTGQIVSVVGQMATDVPAAIEPMTTGVADTVDTMSQTTVQSVTDLGDGFTLTMTNMGTDSLAVITDSTGQIVNTIGAMATEVPTSLDTMATTGLVSVTTLSDGSVLSINNMGSLTTASVADMNGKIVNEFGVMQTEGSQSAALMNTDVVTSVQTMDTGATLAAQTMKDAVVASGELMQSSVTTSTGTMSSTAVGAAQSMSSGVGAAASTMSSTATTASSTMATNVTRNVGTMSLDSISKADDMRKGVTTKAADMVTGVGTETDKLKTVVPGAISSAKSASEGAAEALGKGVTQAVAKGITSNSDIIAKAVEKAVEQAVAKANPSGGSGGHSTASVSAIMPSSTQLDTMPMRGDGGVLDIDYERLARLIADASSARNFNLTVHSNAEHEPLVQDFAVLEALSRSGT